MAGRLSDESVRWEGDMGPERSERLDLLLERVGMAHMEVSDGDLLSKAG